MCVCAFLRSNSGGVWRRDRTRREGRGEDDDEDDDDDDGYDDNGQVGKGERKKKSS